MYFIVASGLSLRLAVGTLDSEISYNGAETDLFLSFCENF